MKNLITVLLLIAVSFGIISFYGNTNESNQSLAVDSKQIDANTISTWFRNNGSFNRNPVTTNAGFIWPKGTTKTARFASGPWIGAKVGNDTLVTITEYDYEFINGYTDNNGNPQGKDDPAYRIYKLVYGQPNQDRQQWPNSLLGNSNQGAPVFYDTLAHVWRPLDFGNQTMFYRYTDSYPITHQVQGGSTVPLKVDIKQVNYAFDAYGSMANVIFSYFTIINRNSVAWTNTYMTIWSDDDLGYAVDDLVGCDTTMHMGFTYNGSNNDPVYGAAPPAVATFWLKGPTVYTGNYTDTAYYCEGQHKIAKARYKSLGLSVFNWYSIGNDPANFRESYRYMSGLNRNGTPIINPVTGQPTKFVFSGDPVTGTGWRQTTPDDQRFLMSTGPFTVNPGDTNIIVMAQVIARGSSNLNSIALLRQFRVETLHEFYVCFAEMSLGIEKNSTVIQTYNLHQNYPNPFNPKTKINYEIPITNHVRLSIYDVLGREVAVLLDKLQRYGTYEVEWDGSNYTSGVYFYKLTAGSYTDTKKMVLVK